jgi:hypothetical protein
VRFTLPLPKNLKRFLALLFVFIFGIFFSLEVDKECLGMPFRRITQKLNAQI